MEYKDLKLNFGLTNSLSFDIADEFGVALDPEDYTWDLSFYSNDQPSTLLLSLTSPDAQSRSGKLIFNVSDQDSTSLYKNLSTYKVISTKKTDSTKTLQYKGFAAVDASESSGIIPNYNVTILPDGTIYPKVEITVVPNVWYAVVSNFRFIISGFGAFVIDGKDLTNTIFGNLQVCETNSFEQTQWVPDLSNKVAFRIKQVSGTSTIRYLP